MLSSQTHNQTSVILIVVSLKHPPEYTYNHHKPKPPPGKFFYLHSMKQ